MGKKVAGTKNVYELAQERLKVIFSEFDNIYVSFSGGKDSGVLLNMCIDYIRKNNLKIRLGVFHMDYEIQYKMTIDYVDRILEANKDILDVYRVCIPFRVSTCTSMYQSFWRPWEDSKKNIWVRSMPKKAMTNATIKSKIKAINSFQAPIMLKMTTAISQRQPVLPPPPPPPPR